MQLSDLGWSAFFEQHFSDLKQPALHPARVVEVIKPKIGTISRRSVTGSRSLPGKKAVRALSTSCRGKRSCRARRQGETKRNKSSPATSTQYSSSAHSIENSTCGGSSVISPLFWKVVRVPLCSSTRPTFARLRMDSWPMSKVSRWALPSTC
jgi:hypothetical protein